MLKPLPLPCALVKENAAGAGVVGIGPRGTVPRAWGCMTTPPTDWMPGELLSEGPSSDASTFAASKCGGGGPGGGQGGGVGGVGIGPLGVVSGSVTKPVVVGGSVRASVESSLQKPDNVRII